MRAAMMADLPISAAIFVGGMEGILEEFDTVGQAHPGSHWYDREVPHRSYPAMTPVFGPSTSDQADELLE